LNEGHSRSLQKHSFYQFVSVHWPTYYRQSTKTRLSKVAKQLFQEVVSLPQPSDAFQYWIFAYRDYYESARNTIRAQSVTLDREPSSNNQVEAGHSTEPFSSIRESDQIQLIPPEELFVNGIPARGLAATAFGLDELLLSLPEEELIVRNDHGRSCIEVARQFGPFRAQAVCETLLKDRLRQDPGLTQLESFLERAMTSGYSASPESSSRCKVPRPVSNWLPR
jgi:hypothetical protein